ncbi:hypothetical protein [Microbacterium sp.]|uniref:hypothetical protein n=1 Tax=Microbacterium sp. TaxID=51671 RepID=UPI002FE04F40
MIEIPRSTPQGRNGSWSVQVDVLARHLNVVPRLPIEQAARRYPGIPMEVLEHIYAERKRRRQILKEAN